MLTIQIYDVNRHYITLHLFTLSINMWVSYLYLRLWYIFGFIKYFHYLHSKRIVLHNELFLKKSQDITRGFEM